MHPTIALRAFTPSSKNARQDFRAVDESEPMKELEISVSELQQRQQAAERFLLVDVREPWEYDLCRIEGAKLVPMGTIPANLQLLDSGEDVICYCHHGQRSLDVAAWLRAQGIESAQSLAGGIDRWSSEIDPAVPRY